MLGPPKVRCLDHPIGRSIEELVPSMANPRLEWCSGVYRHTPPRSPLPIFNGLRCYTTLFQTQLQVLLRRRRKVALSSEALATGCGPTWYGSF